MFLKILKENRMNSIKKGCLVLFLIMSELSYSQDLDSNLIGDNSKLLVFLDYCIQNVHSKEEINCFLNSNEHGIKTEFLSKVNFENYVFVSCSFSTKHDKNEGVDQGCIYRINIDHSNFVIAFDLKHKRAYKLKGFCWSSDFKRFYNDYMHFESKSIKGSKKKQKRDFLKTHKIEGVDLEILWDLFM